MSALVYKDLFKFWFDIFDNKLALTGRYYLISLTVHKDYGNFQLYFFVEGYTKRIVLLSYTFF